MSPGLYMRDIAEVRGGFDSFDFKKNANAPLDPDLCLSLIGSERTISLELPGKVRLMPSSPNEQTIEGFRFIIGSPCEFIFYVDGKRLVFGAITIDSPRHINR